MAKAKTVEVEQEEGQTPQTQLMSLFKANKTDHLNFETTQYYKVPSSSMILNSIMDGGLTPGCHRFCGTTSGGKSSAALDFLNKFLNEVLLNLLKEERRGVYFKCEGRLSKEIMLRSGVTFTEDINEWKNGTCLIVDSNIFEFVFDVMRQLIQHNETKCKYFFITDSVDMMVKRDDAAKSFEESQQVAGGALLTSTFLKKVGNAMSKRGHIAIFISQIRETVKINPYDKTPPKQGNASGGHALEHAGDFVLEFLPRFPGGEDIIREGGETKGKPLGHFAKVKIVKSNNEKYLQEARYPICYGRIGGTSIWREKEIYDMLTMWELVKRKGSYYVIDESIIKELAEQSITIPDQFQGEPRVHAWLDANPAAVDYLAKKFEKMIS